MKIIAIKHRLFRDLIKVQAEKDETWINASIGRTWILKQGQTITVSVSKKRMFEFGEQVDFLYCIKRDVNSFNPQIPFKDN